MLGETIINHVDRYLEAGKAAEPLIKKLLCNDDFLAPIASFVQTKTMEKIIDKRRFELFKSTSMGTRAKSDAAVAAKASNVKEARDHWSSERSTT